MGKISKNYFLNLLYQILLIIVPLVMAPYLSRTICAEGTGQYAYVNSIASIITTFSLLGIYTYGNRQIAYYRDDKAKLNDTFWQIMSCRIIFLLVGSAIYFAAIIVINKYFILFLAYYTYFLGYCLDCTWLYVGVEDMKWAVIKNALIKILATVLIFIFVHTESDTFFYVLIQGGSILIGNLIAYAQVKLYVGKPKFDLSNFGNDIKGCFLLFLPGVASLIYLQADKIMIEAITQSTAQVSFYDYSEKIITLPLTVITVISTVLMPRIANAYKKSDQKQIQELLTISAKLTMWIGMPLMIGIFVISDKFIPWYLGDEFLPAITSIKILSPLVIFNSLTGISQSQYFVATNQTKIMTISQFSTAGLNMILNAILIPLYGYIGAAIATIASYCLLTVIEYIFFMKQIKLKGFFYESIKYFAFSAAMGIVVYFTGYFMPTKWYVTFIQIIAGGVFYMLLCLIFKDGQLKFALNYAKRIFHKKEKTNE